MSIKLLFCLYGGYPAPTSGVSHHKALDRFWRKESNECQKYAKKSKPNANKGKYTVKNVHLCRLSPAVLTQDYKHVLPSEERNVS